MYKKRWLSFLLLCLLLTMPACAVGPGQPAADQAGGAVWTTALEDNPSAAAWRELLSKGPLVVDMHDYGGFEKVGSIGVLGPTRMPYPKVIALVEQIGQQVSRKSGGRAIDNYNKED